ncbi:MAG TPA: hypothetical protein VF671_13330 [Pseudomonas sp.]|jgi:hypothetical protein|uniref:hypothetical protein n=1 Tax=Pseudomonas sp. TaxID=306 RepID=UPI002EDAB400
MIPKFVSDLHAIASKPGVTPGTLLIVTRRTCRILLTVRDGIWRERKDFLRTVLKISRHLPRSARDIEMLVELADTYRAAEYEYARARLVELGRLLSSDGSAVAERLGFDRLCDILNVNPARRSELHLERCRTLRGLIFEENVEDSADIENELWAGRGPLCEAFYAAHCHDLVQNSLRVLEQPSS